MAPMERVEVMKLVREHLSTELEVAAEKIQPETRFREDLDAGAFDVVVAVLDSGVGEGDDRAGLRQVERVGAAGLFE